MSKIIRMGRVGIAILEIGIIFGFSYIFGVSKVSTVIGMGRVGNGIFEIGIVFDFSYLFDVSKVSIIRDGAGRGRHPRNYHLF